MKQCTHRRFFRCFPSFRVERRRGEKERGSGRASDRETWEKTQWQERAINTKGEERCKTRLVVPRGGISGPLNWATCDFYCSCSFLLPRVCVHIYCLSYTDYPSSSSRVYRMRTRHPFLSLFLKNAFTDGIFCFLHDFCHLLLTRSLFIFDKLLGYVFTKTWSLYFFCHVCTTNLLCLSSPFVAETTAC